MTRYKTRVRGAPSLIQGKTLALLLLLFLFLLGGWFFYEWKGLQTENEATSPTLANNWTNVLQRMKERGPQVLAIVERKIRGAANEPEQAFEPATEEMARTAWAEAVPLVQYATSADDLMDGVFQQLVKNLERTWDQANLDLEAGDWTTAHGRYREVIEKAPGLISQMELIQSVVRRQGYIGKIRHAAEDRAAKDPDNPYWDRATAIYEEATQAARQRNYEQSLELFEQSGKTYIAAQSYAKFSREYRQAQQEIGAALDELDAALMKEHGGETWVNVLESVRLGRESEKNMEAGAQAYRDALQLLPEAVREAKHAMESTQADSLIQEAKTLAEQGRTAEAAATLETLLARTDKDASRPMELLQEILLRNGEEQGVIEIAFPLAPDVDLPLIYIHPGTFAMGAGNHETEEQPVHEVKISRGFWMGRHEVTRAQYNSVMSPHQSAVSDPEFPVTQVSRDGARSFCQRLDRSRGIKTRLPTEAEWEYACRAGTMSEYSFNGDASLLAEHGNVKGSGPGAIQKVGSYKPNPWGLSDMHGNVFEWVADYYASDTYTSGPETDPRGPSEGKQQVVRGGCWRFGPDLARSSSRYRYLPEYGSDYVGFRVVVEMGN